MNRDLKASGFSGAFNFLGFNIMPTILVIDDDPSFRRMFKEIFPAQEYQILEAENGDKGLAVFRSQPVDVVVTDILMPDCDGIVFIQKLLKERPSSKIIAMSGQPHLFHVCNTLHIAKRLGAKHCLEKPFSIQAIRDLVHQVLSR